MADVNDLMRILLGRETRWERLKRKAYRFFYVFRPAGKYAKWSWCEKCKKRWHPDDLEGQAWMREGEEPGPDDWVYFAPCNHPVSAVWTRKQVLNA